MTDSRVFLISLSSWCYRANTDENILVKGFKGQFTIITRSRVIRSRVSGSRVKYLRATDIFT